MAGINDKQIDSLVETGQLTSSTAAQVKQNRASQENIRKAERAEEDAEDLLAIRDQAVVLEQQQAEQQPIPQALTEAPSPLAEQLPLAPLEVGGQLVPIGPESVPPQEVSELQPEEFVQPTEQVAEEIPTAIPGEDPFQQEIAGVRDVAEVQAEEARNLADFQEQQLQAGQLAAARAQNEAIQDEEEIRNRNIDLDIVRREFGELVEKADPQRFVKNLNLGEKLIAFIGIALGGAGGGPNNAFRAFQNSIDRDIAAQNAEIDGVGKRIQQGENLIERLQGIFKDRNSATKAARLMQLESFERQLEVTRSKFTSPKILANADILAARIGQEKIKFQREFDLAVIQAKGKNPLSRVGSDIDPATITKAEENRRVFDADGRFLGLASSGQLTKDLREHLSSNAQGQVLIEKLLAIGDKPFSKFSPADRNIVQTLRGLQKSTLRLMIAGPGVTSDFDIRLIDEAQGNINAFLVFPGTQRAKILELQKFLKTGIQAKLGLAGLNPNVAFQPEAQESAE